MDRILKNVGINELSLNFRKSCLNILFNNPRLIRLLLTQPTQSFSCKDLLFFGKMIV